MKWEDMETFYLQNRIDNLSDERAAIVEILKARGFLIDSKEGHYFLSSNAEAKDIDYLDERLKKYNLGKIVNKGKLAESSRRNWDIYGSDSIVVCYPEEEAVEVVVSKDASIHDAINLFNDMPRNGSEAGPCKKSWYQYSTEVLPYKVPVCFLEAYVALYVKAISACGVETCYSCDGNHKHGGKIFVWASYPYTIWHKAIWDNIIIKFFGPIPFIEDGIPFTEETQQDVYQTVNTIAVFLYENRIKIRDIKKRTMCCLEKKYIRPLIRAGKLKDIEQFYEDTCKRMIDQEF